jgi:ribosomal protein S18 acetylase RimI-like enzyme
MMVQQLNSRLGQLGPWLATLLHWHMATSRHCLCLVAEQDAAVVGYGSVLTATRRFNRSFLLSKGPISAVAVLPWMLRPSNVATVLRGLTYFPQTPMDDPPAELVSLVVSPIAQGVGVGSALFSELMARAKRHGIARVKICTDVENDGANRFYLRHGCRLLRSERLYRDSHVNVYVRDIA